MLRALAIVLAMDELATMHGPHERVSVANVRRGWRVLLETVLEVAAQ